LTARQSEPQANHQHCRKGVTQLSSQPREKDRAIVSNKSLSDISHNLLKGRFECLVALAATGGSEGVLFDAAQKLRRAIQYAMDRYEFDVRKLLHRRQDEHPGVRPRAYPPECPEVSTFSLPDDGEHWTTMHYTWWLQMDFGHFLTRLQMCRRIRRLLCGARTAK